MRAELLLGAHLGACLVAVALAHARLPARYRRPLLPGLLLLFALAFTIPVVGPLGLVLVLPRALRRAAAIPSAPRVRLVGLSPAPDVPAGGRVRRATPSSGIVRAADPSRRAAVLTALGRLQRRGESVLVRLALRDPVDDVRLLAFSALDRRVRGLERAAAEDLASLDRYHPPREAAALHRRLAETAWELCYLELVRSDLRGETFARARFHAEAALAIGGERAGLRLLLGRIHLAEGALLRAWRELSAALRLGAAERTVLPYLAEVAFRRGRPALTRRLLARLAATPAGGAPFLRLWTRRARA